MDILVINLRSIKSKCDFYLFRGSCTFFSVLGKYHELLLKHLVPNYAVLKQHHNMEIFIWNINVTKQQCIIYKQM